MTALLALSAACVLGADFQGSTHLLPFDEETINYSKAVAENPVHVT